MSEFTWKIEHFKIIQLCGSIIEHCFSNFNVHRNPLGLLFKDANSGGIDL